MAIAFASMPTRLLILGDTDLQFYNSSLNLPCNVSSKEEIM